MPPHLYTRSGDAGTTALASGERVSKGCDDVEAYGTLDELNSFIGMLITQVLPEDRATLQAIQQRLFDAGAVLARSKKAEEAAARLDAAWLEARIDEMEQVVSARREGFVLPGGEQAAAWAHICRSVCRRAERQICRLDVAAPAGTKTLVFINRLSDYFFALARKINKFSGIAEINVE